MSVRLLKVNGGTDEISEPQNFVLKIRKNFHVLYERMSLRYRTSMKGENKMAKEFDSFKKQYDGFMKWSVKQANKVMEDGGEEV